MTMLLQNSFSIKPVSYTVWENSDLLTSIFLFENDNFRGLWGRRCETVQGAFSHIICRYVLTEHIYDLKTITTTAIVCSMQLSILCFILKGVKSNYGTLNEMVAAKYVLWVLFYSALINCLFIISSITEQICHLLSVKLMSAVTIFW